MTSLGDHVSLFHMAHLPYLVVKFEDPNAMDMVQSLAGWNPDGLAVLYNYKGEVVVHGPAGRHGLRPRARYFTPGTWNANRWLKWPRLTWILCGIVARLAFRYQIRVAYFGGQDIVAWFAQAFKFAGRIEQTMTTVEDWNLPKAGDSFAEHFNLRKILLNDLILSWFDTTVITINKEIHERRRQYWGDRVTANTVLRDGQWAWFMKRPGFERQATPGTEILLLGNLRRHMGVETLFGLLPDLHRDHGLTLRIIGPESDIYSHYRELSRKMGLDDMIQWRGYVDAAELPNELNRVFCGLCLHEIPENTTRWAIAGRVQHYIKNLVVPVVTPYSGAIVEFIREHGIGIVCETDPASIRDAILAVRADHAKYLARLRDLLDHNPYRIPPEEILAPRRSKTL